jgi:hypothetical protein
MSRGLEVWSAENLQKLLENKKLSTHLKGLSHEI